MDVICTTCGEPWDVFTAYEELTLNKSGVPVACPSCNGVEPKGMSPRQRQYLDDVAKAAELLGGDLDGLAAMLEDLEVFV